MNEAPKNSVQQLAIDALKNLGIVGTNATAMIRELSNAGVELAKIPEHIIQLTTAGIDVTKDNLKAASELSVAGMAVTKDNLVAASKLSVAGINASRENLEAASKLIVAGIDFTEQGVEEAKKSLKAASRLVAIGTDISVDSLQNAKTMLNTGMRISNDVMTNVSDMMKPTLGMISSIAKSVNLIIESGFDTIRKKIDERTEYYKEKQRVETENHIRTTNVTQDIIAKIKNDAVNRFNIYITGLIYDANNLKSTLVAFIHKLHNTYKSECSTSRFRGIRKCEQIEVSMRESINAKVETLIRSINNDFNNYVNKLKQKNMLFKSNIYSINGTTIEALNANITDSEHKYKPENIEDLTENYNQQINIISNAMNKQTDATNEQLRISAGRKQTRRKNRHTKKTSRRHKKRTYKRVRF